MSGVERQKDREVKRVEKGRGHIRQEDRENM